jgi:hypothetical protein
VTVVRRIGEFEDGKARDAATRLILIVLTNPNVDLGRYSIATPRGNTIIIIAGENNYSVSIKFMSF